MKKQLIGNNKYLLSFRRDELKTVSVIELIKKLKEYPEPTVKKISDYNYEVAPSVLSLTDDIGYGPFTKEESIKGELEFYEFMRQFDDEKDLL